MPFTKRKTVFTVETPLQRVEFVTLFEDTLKSHIEFGHPEIAGKAFNIQSTLKAPSAIVQADNPPTNFVFINDLDVDQMGYPLAVLVNPVDNETGTPFVATAFYNRKHRKTEVRDKMQLWPEIKK